MKFDIAAYVHFNYMFVTIEWQDDTYAEMIIMLQSFHNRAHSFSYIRPNCSSPMKWV